MDREQSVVIFKGLTQSNCSLIANIVILQTYLFQTVHHLHALSNSFTSLWSKVVLATVNFADTIIVSELLSDLDSSIHPNVILIDVQHSQYTLDRRKYRDINNYIRFNEVTTEDDMWAGAIQGL